LPISAATLGEVTRLAAYAIFLASYVVFALGTFPGMKIDRPHITFGEYMRAGVPVTLLTLGFGWLFLTFLR
jgi:hypothetical protein